MHLTLLLATTTLSTFTLIAARPLPVLTVASPVQPTAVINPNLGQPVYNAQGAVIWNTGWGHGLQITSSTPEDERPVSVGKPPVQPGSPVSGTPGTTSGSTPPAVGNLPTAQNNNNAEPLTRALLGVAPHHPVSSSAGPGKPNPKTHLAGHHGNYNRKISHHAKGRVHNEYYHEHWEKPKSGNQQGGTR